MAVTKDTIKQDLYNRYQAGGYKKKTDEELNQQAQQEFGGYYDQLRLGAEQQAAKNDLALQQQKAALDYAFAKQQEAAEKEYNKVYSQADRQLLSRGMQRSSYGAQTLANIRQQQADVYMDLESQLAAQGADIEAKRVQLGDQLAAQINQYNAAQAQDELNRLRELQDQEYERGVKADAAQNELALQLYQLLGSDGGSGGGSGGSTAKTPTAGTSGATSTTGSSFANVMAEFGNGNTSGIARAVASSAKNTLSGALASSAKNTLAQALLKNMKKNVSIN